MSDLTHRFKAMVIKDSVVMSTETQALYRRTVHSYEGKHIIIILKRWRKRRTLKQNAYYWGCLVPMIAEYHGYEDTPEELLEVHNGLKLKFLRKVGRNGFISIMSTRELSTVGFIDYIDRIVRHYAKEAHFVLPDPKTWVEPEEGAAVYE